MVAEWARHQAIDGCADLTKSSRRRVQAADLTGRAEKAERALEETKRARDTAVQKVRPRTSLAIGPYVGMGH